MKSFPNANQLRGRAVGSIFFACFGVGWLFLSLAAKHQITFATVSGALLGMLVLLAAALNLIGLAKGWPRIPADPNTGRIFALINAIQWIAIPVAVIALGNLHLGVYATSAIAAIIGVHMFPLARLFHYPMHYVTGAALVTWAALSALLVAPGELQGSAAMGTGFILWASAAVTLFRSQQAARQAVPG